MSEPQNSNNPSEESQNINPTQGNDQTGTSSNGLTGTPDNSKHEPETQDSAQEVMDPLSKALAEVAILQAKVSELNHQFLRGQADVQNARRRADEEVSKARKFAIEAFA